LRRRWTRLLRSQNRKRNQCNDREHSTPSDCAFVWLWAHHPHHPYPRFQDYQASGRECSCVGVRHLEYRASRTDGPLARQMPESRPRSSLTITRRIATQRKSMLPAAA
jgi:hypothetical protein